MCFTKIKFCWASEQKIPSSCVEQRCVLCPDLKQKILESLHCQCPHPSWITAHIVLNAGNTEALETLFESQCRMWGFFSFKSLFWVPVSCPPHLGCITQRSQVDSALQQLCEWGSGLAAKRGPCAVQTIALDWNCGEESSQEGQKAEERPCNLLEGLYYKQEQEGFSMPGKNKLCR